MLFAIECIAKHTNLDIPLLDIYDRHSDLFLRFPSGNFREFLNLLCNFWKNRSAEYSKFTGHSAYVATETESDGAKIDGLLPPNFL